MLPHQNSMTKSHMQPPMSLPSPFSSSYLLNALSQHHVKADISRTLHHEFPQVSLKSEKPHQPREAAQLTSTWEDLAPVCNCDVLELFLSSSSFTSIHITSRYLFSFLLHDYFPVRLLVAAHWDPAENTHMLPALYSCFCKTCRLA